MRQDLTKTIDNTIQAAIATNMEKLSQSTQAMVKDMFAGFMKQTNNLQPPANKMTQCQPTVIAPSTSTDETIKPTSSGYHGSYK